MLIHTSRIFGIGIPKLPWRIDLLRLDRALGIEDAQDVRCQFDVGHGNAAEQRLFVVVEVFECP